MKFVFISSELVPPTSATPVDKDANVPAQFWQEALEDIGHDSVKQDDWDKRADIHVSSTCVDQYIYIYICIVFLCV